MGNKVQNVDLYKDTSLASRDVLTNDVVSSVDVDHTTGQVLITEPFHCAGFMGGTVTLRSQAPNVQLWGMSNVSSLTFQSIPEHYNLYYPLDARVDYTHHKIWIADSGNNRVIKMDSVAESVEGIFEDQCVLPVAVIPDVNNGGVFVRAYKNASTGCIIVLDSNGIETFRATYDDRVPFESLGGAWYSGDLIVINSDGTKSSISRVDRAGAINFSNVSSNPTQLVVSNFSGEIAVVYSNPNNNGKDLVESRLPDGTLVAQVERTDASLYGLATDQFGGCLWASSYNDDLESSVPERLRCDPYAKTWETVGFARRVSNLLSSCVSSQRRELYVLHDNGETVSIFSTNGHILIKTINIASHGRFVSISEDIVTGDIWLLRDDGLELLRIVDDSIYSPIYFERVIKDFVVVSRFGSDSLFVYLLSDNGVMSCVYKVECTGTSWTIQNTYFLREDTYRKIDYVFATDKLWIASATVIYLLDIATERLDFIASQWDNIVSIAVQNYWRDYDSVSRPLGEVLVPLVNTVCYDYVRSRLWWGSSPKIFMMDMKNRQVISQSLDVYGCTAIYGMDVDFGSGNLIVSIDISASRHHIIQVDADNNGVLSWTFLPYRFPSFPPDTN
jgi:DNA-binding beta-propeller fold protein YncE